MNKDFDELKKDIEIELNRQYLKDEERVRKLRASRYELMIYMILFVFSTFSKALFSLGYLRDLVLEQFSLPVAVIAGGLMFISYFTFILNGETLLVSIISNNKFKFSFSTPLGSIKIEDKDDSWSQNSAINRLKPDQDEAFEDYFLSYVSRSQETAKIAQRRPNALLFAGATIAALGLIFFIVTLPGSRFGILISENNPEITTADYWKSLILLFPRLLMLIFIQVLAGFFLRQYRVSMEEFRYYEALLRIREAQFMSYKIIARSQDKRALTAFTAELLRYKDIAEIRNGKKTTIADAQEREGNEILTAIQSLTSTVEAVLKPKPKVPEAP
ncbi:hypothetical protein [Inquilinus limosus]|uniref:hypothetical protein n=1 Tax=Inquilinus limosus TaxID=171674 RepID=UPI001198226D|nr:hypothetical protein [Inquilinus limosus]